MSPIDTITQVSAGGVVYRRLAEKIEVVLILVGPNARWQLPKGTIDEGESNEQAALREVREETGLQADLLDLLERIEYWFYANRASKRVRYHKFVFFYLMEYRSGDVSDHDHEVEEARWFEIGEAIQKLAFESEKNVVQKALERVETPRQNTTSS